MNYLFYFLFYGFLLTAVMGLLASWIDRKLTARVQYRVGPPLLQPLIDIIKLLGKETLLPKGGFKVTFLMAPVIGLSAVILVSAMLWVNTLSYGNSFLGDIIVVLYLLVIPSLSLMLGGFASGNIYASLGSSREMRLILSYELPFMLAMFVPVIKSGFSLTIAGILAYQAESSFVAASLSGALALAVGVLCIQAKLGLVPFDIPEAETEIIGGPLIEYSGSALAIYKLMKNMLLFTLPFFLIILFLGGLSFSWAGIFYSILKYLSLLAAVIVIRNTNPRLRIDQALRFFWGPVTLTA
jgi:NADH-quinone oxidoreductase subunit H